MLFVVTGLSGAGKTSLVKRIVEDFGVKLNLQLIVSYTTRIPRYGEIAGKDYIFLTAHDFEKKEKEGFFLETTKYNNNFYGTPGGISLNDKNFLVVTDIAGAITIKEKLGEKVRLIFIGVPSLQEASRRILSRGLDSKIEAEQREEHNLQDLAFFIKHKDLFSCAINNENFEASLRELTSFISSLVY